MANTNKEGLKLAGNDTQGLNIEGPNPTRAHARNGYKEAEPDACTEGQGASLRGNDMPPALVVDRLLTAAGRAWVVGVGRLLHLASEGAEHLPEDFAPRLAARHDPSPPRLEPDSLLAHARVLGATIIAARAAYGRLPDLVTAPRVMRAVVSVAQISGPGYRHQRQLELLGLHWVEQCLSALELAVSDWPYKAYELAHVPQEGTLPELGPVPLTMAERHAVDVVAETLPASSPEPLSLIAQALATWEFSSLEVDDLLAEDAELAEGDWSRAKTAWQILWRIGAGAQVVARVRARAGAR